MPYKWQVAPAIVPSPVSRSPLRHSACASEIIPRLYISDLSTAESLASLSALGITHVLTTMSGRVTIPSHIYTTQIHIEDSPFAELAAHLPSTSAWIREALRSDPNARVLVHCAEGISRSTSVVTAFLMAQFGWGVERAVAVVKSKRKIADPNFGFVQQLHEYEEVLRNSRS